MVRRKHHYYVYVVVLDDTVWNFWIATVTDALLLSAFAAGIYRFVERPGIKRGRIVGKKATYLAERVLTRFSFGR
ncbi:hypothetical protein bAD24_III08555 [Burkholderia sp. AD24]|nr:hypothetical protein bAD24_III08555 [Burkholderia sp. AD24]